MPKTAAKNSNIFGIISPELENKNNDYCESHFRRRSKKTRMSFELSVKYSFVPVISRLENLFMPKFVGAVVVVVVAAAAVAVFPIARACIRTDMCRYKKASV